jgi:extradiol dioxygenase family protein
MMRAMTTLTPFHIAVQVRDLEEARHFYKGALGCSEGRSSEHWVDFNLFGHQFVVHLNEALGKDGRISQIHNAVDGHGVPVPHCGVVLTMEAFDALAQRIRAAGEKFVIEPYVRFKGLPGEQATMFLLDPSGNALEFKAFKDIAKQLFET